MLANNYITLEMQTLIPEVNSASVFSRPTAASHGLV
jgi:hypothetical protein